MLKNILNIEGAQTLSKQELKSISGSKSLCTPSYTVCTYNPAICHRGEQCIFLDVDATEAVCYC